jgi:HSP20 family protein
MEEQTTQASQDAKNTTQNKPTSNQQQPNQQELARASSSTAVRPVVGGAWASPFSLLRVFMDDLDRLVEGFGSGANTLAAGSPASTRSIQNWIPAVEAFERDGQFLIRVDVPGLDREQLAVEIDDGKVIIAGEREDEDEDRGSNYYRRERSYGRFTRVIPLPDGVDASEASATFANGVLEISMPAPQRPETRKLEIQSGQSISTSKEQPSKHEAAASKPESKAESKH